MNDLNAGRAIHMSDGTKVFAQTTLKVQHVWVIECLRVPFPTASWPRLRQTLQTTTLTSTKTTRQVSSWAVLTPANEGES